MLFTVNIYWTKQWSHHVFLNYIFIYGTFLTKYELPLHGNSVQLTNRYLHDYVTHIFVLSRGHPNFIFTSECGSRVLLVMNKMFSTIVLLEKTLNVNIVLNMPRINIENRVWRITSLRRTFIDYFHSTVYR